MAICRLAPLCAAVTLAGASLAAAAPASKPAGSKLTRLATKPAAAAPAVSGFTAAPSGPTVAVVNGEVITEGEWTARMRLMAGKNALDNLVREKIIRQEARKNGVTVTPQEIAQKAAELESSYRGRFPSPDKFDEFLKAQDLSPAGFQSAIRYSAEMQLLQEKLSDKVGEKVQVSDKELQDLYDKQKAQFVQPAEVRIAQIMLNFTGVDEASQNKTKSDAEALMAKVKAPGADFAALAKQYSQDPETKDKGGEMGWMSYSPWGPPFDQIVMNAPVGLIDQPVRSYKGYHIVKVLEKHPQRSRSFDEIKDELRKRVLEQRRAAEYRQYMQKAVASAKTDIKIQF